MDRWAEARKAVELGLKGSMEMCPDMAGTLLEDDAQGVVHTCVSR